MAARGVTIRRLAEGPCPISPKRDFITPLGAHRSASQAAWPVDLYALAFWGERGRRRHERAATRAAPTIPFYCSAGVFVLGSLPVEERPLLIV